MAAQLRAEQPKIGALHVLPADARAGTDRQYDLARLHLERLYETQSRSLVIDALKVQIEQQYRPDYVLVDSRTGLTDVGGICTVHLADLLVIVSGLNEQNIEGTRLAVERLQRARKDFADNVLVVDNHSTDGTRERLHPYARRHRNLSLIHNRVNRGFGAAHNQAVSVADSAYHVICNPDIRISADVFSPLMGHLDRSSRIGLCCPRFLSEDGTLQPLNRLYPTLLDLFLRRFAPHRLRALARKRLRAYDMQDVLGLR